MQVELRAGAKIDLPSTTEFNEKLDTVADTIRTAARRDYFQVSLAITPDASGTGRLRLYDCPLGSQVELHRIAFSSPGYTASNPLTAGDLEIVLNEISLVNFLPQSGAVAPVVFVEGSGALIMHGGETLSVKYTGLTELINVFIQFRRWNDPR